ncbi:AsnC family transcriptional regulator [Clostridium saccharoperbutylacetonicum]|uniref:siroheme decarboxylase n=1 Tax=Clostridium saccharoperbutylacetonicum N1-4(HMT) TaxID=931276 RepID=M1LYV5_9CLOT|nr:AsnC family transcriptional regulator [Clostridium saccharoperbutylacetonicum]AGF58480.1 transcriptional regulator, AsnC family [Clostridium saccharoperbutylacetonicum N1-4(HMT)]AQR97175.1 DNA-binding transcriptional regulator AsnC [Clostridium saccharoperbutylacetonicum]NRT60742.1 DNA-binding Lrp family transcriptional regulator [Clostridium saccharoperbutylacetonicum]NSB24056.1 DNA-binding Lrp family transcriptional regulator [Clostridium saccharoperbutylacetonicum]NSB33056.1 DNA-binding 
MDTIDKKLLNLIQNEIPIDKRPFKLLGEKLLLTENEVLERVNNLKNQGIIRRIGGIFNSRKIGYTSTLCAAKVPENRIDEVAACINDYYEVTHNYLREDEYNMWFTIITNSNENLNNILQEIKEKTALDQIISLPSVKLFKVKVALNFQGDDNNA